MPERSTQIVGQAARLRLEGDRRRKLEDRLPGSVPPSSPPAQVLRYLLVTALKNSGGTAYTDYATDGFISHLEGNRCNSGGLNVDTSVTLRIKCPRLTFSGVLSGTDDTDGLVVTDVVAYLPGDGIEDVPGGDGYKSDGYLVLGAADDGPSLAHALL